MSADSFPPRARWYVKMHHINMAALCLLMGIGSPIFMVLKPPAIPAGWGLKGVIFWWTLCVGAALAPLACSYWAFCLGRRTLWLFGIGSPCEPVIEPPLRFNAVIMTGFGTLTTIAGVFESPFFLIAGLPVLLLSIPALLWAFERKSPDSETPSCA